MANTTWSTTDKAAGIALSGGNLIARNTSNGAAGVRTIDSHAAGKFYWEYTANTFTFTGSGVGFTSGSTSVSGAINSLNPSAGVRQSSGSVYVNATLQAINLGTVASGTLICVALDCSAQLVWFREAAAGNWNASGTANPATGTGGVAIPGLGAGSIQIFPWIQTNSTNEQVTANFGDSAFTGAVPAGFTAGFTSGGDVAPGGTQARAMVMA